ncbi:MAG TPA: protein-L-isoaspartate(D-aspartate) O-methyltransferase, partial [Ectothiorhodospiraceae bacterium]|nr:protein-L-isoaspartate(D-aspartate) O-methyltransferase [Ectothiorhodospiraceae bacterium]
RGSGMTSPRARERLIARLREQRIVDERVLDVIYNLPRHLFIDEALTHRAYEDTALPIGSGQTISQPYVVARMTEVILEVNPKRVLEVGTGCGYQCAVLSQLVDEVYSIERIDVLYRKAFRILRELKIDNAKLRYGDGYAGWPEKAPFDAILVAAAPEEIPPALLHQLSEGGRLIIPVGSGSQQQLQSFTRRGDEFYQEDLDSVIFVPMLSGAG